MPNYSLSLLFSSTYFYFFLMLSNMYRCLISAHEHASSISLKCSDSLGKNVAQASQSPEFNRCKTVPISEIIEQAVMCFYFCYITYIKLQGVFHIFIKISVVGHGLIFAKG